MNRLLLMLGAMAYLVGCSESAATFNDARLQGVINGKPWYAEKIESITYDFGTRKDKQASIYSVACEEYECLSIKAPSINISNLDTTVESGALSVENSVTIFIPPNRNVKIRDGFYRVSTVGDETKLELKFVLDDNNQVNGYITYQSL